MSNPVYSIVWYFHLMKKFGSLHSYVEYTVMKQEMGKVRGKKVDMKHTALNQWLMLKDLFFLPESPTPLLLLPSSSSSTRPSSSLCFAKSTSSVTRV